MDLISLRSLPTIINRDPIKDNVKTKSTLVPMRKAILLIISAFVFTFGCIKTNYDDCFTPPEIFRMMVVDKETGEDLFNGRPYFTDSLEIYYFQDQVRKKVSFEVKNYNSYEEVIESENLPWISIGGDKTFYIQLNSQDTDTLYLNVVEYLFYYCRSFPYAEVLINNQEMEMNSLGIFLLKK